MVALERLPGLRGLPTRLVAPRDDLVLFESWRGRYADSPRALSEALGAARPDLERVWAADHETSPALPAGVRAVRPGSAAYLRALGQARHVVANTHLPGYFRKRAGTTYLQTWHGTPLKRIGLDIPRPHLPDGARYREQLRHDAARWDVLLSPNPFSTEIFRDAFGYHGEILETGYPRNDALVSTAAPATRERVRRELGIAPATRAVLYAPTWRDADAFALALDLPMLERRLGEGTALLLRLHPLVASLPGALASPSVADVSRHPDIQELFLAADVLVTDYSSVMFDFAVTRKPMLFFVYDLPEYRDQLRGFYFDFEADAPGPLVATTAQLCDALEDLDGVASTHADAYNRFVARFCPHDDGAASQRVIQAVFSS